MKSSRTPAKSEPTKSKFAMCKNTAYTAVSFGGFAFIAAAIVGLFKNEHDDYWFWGILSWCWFEFQFLPSQRYGKVNFPTTMPSTVALAVSSLLTFCVFCVQFSPNFERGVSFFSFCCTFFMLYVLLTLLKLKQVEAKKQEQRNTLNATADESDPPAGSSSLPSSSAGVNLLLSSIHLVASEEPPAENRCYGCCPGCLSIALLATTVLAGFGAFISLSDVKTFPYKGRLFDIGDQEYGKVPGQEMLQSRNLHLYCSGDLVDGLPVVWFEHGWLGSSLDFSWVYGELKKHSRVCAYDRAGYGWSDPGPLPRTSQQIAYEAGRLVDLAKDYIWEGGTVDIEGNIMKGKLMIVGHSMAGMNVRVFQDRNRELVHGIVFADPVNPDYVTGRGYGNRFPGNPLYSAGSWFLGPSGLWPVLLKVLGDKAPIGEEAVKNGHPPEFPDLIPRYASIISRTSWFDTANHEWICWPESAIRTQECGVDRDGKVGDLPIHVFVAKKTKAFNSYKETIKVGDISTRSNVTILPDAQHGFIFDPQYKDMLVEAVLHIMHKY